MSDVHDFWAGRVSSLPGIKPVYAGPPPPPCTPIRRNRLTGAYQMPAPVWQEARAGTSGEGVSGVEEPVIEPVQSCWYSVAEKFNYLELNNASAGNNHSKR